MKHCQENGHIWSTISFVLHYCSSSAWTEKQQEKKYTIQQVSIPYQKEISFQSGEILLNISYWNLRTTFQCAFQCPLLSSLPIQSLTWRLHLFWFLHTDKKNIKRGRGKNYRQQLRNFNHKGNQKIGCYPKSLLIFTPYQGQGWRTMILSKVKYQPDRLVNRVTLLCRFRERSSRVSPPYRVGRQKIWFLFIGIRE